jgi:hypothetical protein
MRMPHTKSADTGRLVVAGPPFSWNKGLGRAFVGLGTYSSLAVLIAMDTYLQANDSSEACQRLVEAEACITRQHQLAEKFQAHGHLRQARLAREILATFVKSYLLIQDCRSRIEGAPQNLGARDRLSG